MSEPIQLRDAAVGFGGGYLDAAGESRGNGTAALLTTTGRSGSLVPIGTQNAVVFKVGPGELVQVAAVQAAAGTVVNFFDAKDAAGMDDSTMIWQGTPGVTPTIIGYPFKLGLVGFFDAASTANVTVVFT